MTQSAITAIYPHKKKKKQLSNQLLFLLMAGNHPEGSEMCSLMLRDECLYELRGQCNLYYVPFLTNFYII